MDVKKPITWPKVPRGLTERDRQRPDREEMYRQMAEWRAGAWEEKVRAYEANREDFYAAWQWLEYHPLFWYFGPEVHERSLVWTRGIHDGLEFQAVKVNPATGEIDLEEELNTQVQIWVEVFASSLQLNGRDHSMHIYEADSGGDTYEEAVINVAHNIYTRHGNDRVQVERLGHR